MAATDRYRLLKPADTISTLRSLPRRVRAELFADPQLDPRRWSDQPGRDGYGVNGLLRAAGANVAALGDAAGRASVLDGEPTPELVAPSTDPADLDDVLAAFDSQVAAAAARLDAIPASGWARPHVLSLAQDAARAGAEAVRQLARLVPEVSARG